MSTTGAPIKEETFTISRQGRHIPVYAASPKDNSQHPAVIIVHEIFGLNEHIKDVARRFAAQNIVAYAPCLFDHHKGLPENRNDVQAMRDVWKSIPDDQLIGDLQEVFYHARKQENVNPQGIGSIGYCMGGAIAFMFACRNPLLAFTIDYYGRIFYPSLDTNKPRHPYDYTGGLNCPLLGLFAGVDDLIPPAQIEMFKEKLTDLGKTFSMKVYSESKHAFFNDQREFYHQDAAEDAWKLTLDFINRHGNAAANR